MPSHKRYEEDILNPIVEKYFQEKGFQVKHEITISLDKFPKLKKQSPRIRFDIIGASKDETVIIEIKAAVYPQILGTCIGELLTYKTIFSEYFDSIKSNFTALQKDKIKVYCAFPDFNCPYSKWSPEYDSLFKNVCGNYNSNIGLLLIKEKSPSDNVI